MLTLAHPDESHMQKYGRFGETPVLRDLDHESKMRLLKTHSHTSNGLAMDGGCSRGLLLPQGDTTGPKSRGLVFPEGNIIADPQMSNEATDGLAPSVFAIFAVSDLLPVPLGQT